MLKMGSQFHVHLFILYLLGLTVAGQESIEFLSLYESIDEVSQASSSSQPDLLIAVPVSYEDLNGVSSSILLSENWLKSKVLAHYPAMKITTIVVNSDFFQQGQEEQKFPDLVLPSLKNLYHSLKRWGLEKDIKVSFTFSFNYLPLHLKMANLKPLMDYLQIVNSTYTLIPNSEFFSPFSYESLSFVSSHLNSMKNIGFSYLKKVNVIANIHPKGTKPITRKLSLIDSSLIGPYPLRSTPPSDIAEPPIMHQFFESPSPSPMPYSSTLAPKLPPPPLPSPPFIAPADSPHGFTTTLPPCNPIQHGSPEPQEGWSRKSWCVAKPSVPAAKLQQALEYACGEGGADCEEITAMGKCYNPDNVVAHASYAFNSYWQKHKRNGGTCYFGGTAMLIDSDPSFLHCRFILS